MNKRVIFALLGVGAVVIMSLSALGIYKTQCLKRQTQKLLNTKLETLALQLKEQDIKMKYQPFECSGLIFIECKNKEIEFKAPLLYDNPLRFDNMVLKSEEIDFKSLTLALSSDLSISYIEGIDEYIQAVFPKKLKMSIKLLALDEENYKIDTNVFFHANNIEYQARINGAIFSPALEDRGLFYMVENLDLKRDKIALKDMSFSLTSNNLSNTIYEITKQKYNKWNKDEYEAIVGLMVGASMMQFEGNAEAQQVIAGMGALVSGEAQQMSVDINSDSQDVFFDDLLKDKKLWLQKIFKHYDFKINLKK